MRMMIRSVSEETFWSNYFYRVHVLKEAHGLSPSSGVVHLLSPCAVVMVAQAPPGTPDSLAAMVLWLQWPPAKKHHSSPMQPDLASPRRSPQETRKAHRAPKKALPLLTTPTTMVLASCWDCYPSLHLTRGRCWCFYSRGRRVLCGAGERAA